MRHIRYDRRGLLRAAAALLLCVGMAVLDPARAQAPVPDAKRAEFMIKTTLIGLNQANITGNYTVLRDLGSPRFRADNNAARLAQIFAPMRDQELDLSPIVVFEPVLAQPIVSDEEGRLRLVGYFPTEPLRVVFDLAFEPIGNRWMISDIAVNAVHRSEGNGEAPSDRGDPEGERQSN